MSNFNPNDEQAVDPMVEHLKKIAESGNVEISWTELKNALTSRLETIIESYKERDETKSEQYDEPNVEKFNLDVSRDEILELIASFTEPPFTIQRICELLYSPFKYYDRISTFFRGLEKNLRVISSNDWPKCPAQTSNNNSSNNNNISPSVDQPATTTSCKQSNDSSDDREQDSPVFLSETAATFDSSSLSPSPTSTSEQPSEEKLLPLQSPKKADEVKIT